ncbi:unnamed protein product [Diabrotica balteata]|uniref:Uncharacterized protein n=1 Tax=Diabrotica balteata TaxID=107213 RepID=A0A9N9SNN6_DIABA|nr:unnamed protein product [Diabrotica balteata]
MITLKKLVINLVKQAKKISEFVICHQTLLKVADVNQDSEIPLSLRVAATRHPVGSGQGLKINGIIGITQVKKDEVDSTAEVNKLGTSSSAQCISDAAFTYMKCEEVITAKVNSNVKENGPLSMQYIANALLTSTKCTKKASSDSDINEIDQNINEINVIEI